MMRTPNAAGAYCFGLIIGIPAFMVVAKLFIWIVPAVARGLAAL